MSTKIRIVIAAVLALGVAYAFLPRDDPMPPGPASTERTGPETEAARTTKEATPVDESDVAASKAATPGPVAQACNKTPRRSMEAIRTITPWAGCSG